MAVELRKTYQKGSLEMLYNYQSESLKQATNVLYQFPSDSSSIVQVKGQPYKPVRLHLTPVLHIGDHDNEMIVEHEGKSGKLFLCFMLKKGTNAQLSFPLNEFSLDGFMSHCIDNQYYRTTTKDHVLLCTRHINVADDFPQVYGTAKKKYKEIFEPNVFNVLNSIMTLIDNKTKVVDIEIESVVLRKAKKRNNIVEGFAPDGVHKIHADTTETYMECSLLEDADGNLDFSEYAISPLQTDAPQQALEVFTILMTMGLVIFVCAIVFPLAQYEIFTRSNLVHWMYYANPIINMVLFILFISLVSAGAADKKKGVASSESKSTTGVYFLVMWLSHGIGTRFWLNGKDFAFEGMFEGSFMSSVETLGSIMFWPTKGYTID